jgi:formate/nitrite transporter FocA (FNT family)
MAGIDAQREDEKKDGSQIELTEQEKTQVEERARPNALVVHEVLRSEGEKELGRPAISLFWSALAAGLSMGFSLVAEGLLRTYLPDAPWRPLVANLGYTVGFIIVIMGRQQLFTENTLTPVLPLLNKPAWKTLGQLIRLWAIVLVSNLAGALAFAWVIGHAGVFEAPVRDNFAALGREAIKGDFWAHLIRGVFAGWLIALVVWLLPAAENSRFQIILTLTYLVGLAGLAHVIAGSVEVLYLVTNNAASWDSYFGGFLAPALLGNILGGVTLVAALNFGQVAPARSEER